MTVASPVLASRSGAPGGWMISPGIMGTGRFCVKAGDDSVGSWADGGGAGIARHRTGWCTVTSFVPSGNVASTCTSWTISGTPSMTSARVKMVAPKLINSETERPSRAPSNISAVIKATVSGWLSLTPRARRRRATSPATTIKSFSCSRGERCIAWPRDYRPAPQAAGTGALMPCLRENA